MSWLASLYLLTKAKYTIDVEPFSSTCFAAPRRLFPAIFHPVLLMPEPAVLRFWVWVHEPTVLTTDPVIL